MRRGGAGVAARAASQVVPVVRQWAAAELLGIDFSGSYGKGTAISPGTDVDLFVSLDSAAGSLKDTYWSLFRWCADHHLPPQAGNVCDGVRVDLVPGRKQKGATTELKYRFPADPVSTVPSNQAQRSLTFVIPTREHNKPRLSFSPHPCHSDTRAQRERRNLLLQPASRSILTPESRLKARNSL